MRKEESAMFRHTSELTYAPDRGPGEGLLGKGLLVTPRPNLKPTLTPHQLRQLMMDPVRSRVQG